MGPIDFEREAFYEVKWLNLGAFFDDIKPNFEKLTMAGRKGNLSNLHLIVVVC